MAKLRATRNMTYKTRRLKAGDEFEEWRPREAQLLKRTGKATDASAPTGRQVPSKARASVSENDNGNGGSGGDQEVTRTDIYRMPKAELAKFIRDHGQEVDEEDESRDDLRDRALDLLP